MSGQLALLTPAPAPRIVFGQSLIRRLVDKASELTWASKRDLMGTCRVRDVSWTRFAVMLVASEQGKPVSLIGRTLGGLDHTSVIYGIRRASEMEASDPDYAELLRLLREEVARG